MLHFMLYALTVPNFLFPAACCGGIRCKGEKLSTQKVYQRKGEKSLRNMTQI
jgi:hypothetical protein